MSWWESELPLLITHGFPRWLCESLNRQSSEANVFPLAEQKGSCFQLFCTTLPHSPCILDLMRGGKKKKATRYNSPKKQITSSHQIPGVLLNGTLWIFNYSYRPPSRKKKQIHWPSSLSLFLYVCLERRKAWSSIYEMPVLLQKSGMPSSISNSCLVYWSRVDPTTPCLLVSGPVSQSRLKNVSWVLCQSCSSFSKRGVNQTFDRLLDCNQC